MINTSKKVILVEDNHAEAKLTKIAFARRFAEAEVVHCSGSEELEDCLAKTHLAEISYILLDLNMPRLSGIEVLKKLKAHEEWKFLPTIIFSSSAFDRDLRQCYELGANAYVVKPVEYEELEATLQAIHLFWSNTNLRAQSHRPSPA